MKSLVRIANASGYWGDDPEALYRQVTGGPLDYVTMDFLAEITMVILQRQRARDAQAPASPTTSSSSSSSRCRRSPSAASPWSSTPAASTRRRAPRRCEALCRKAGVSLPIAVVSGDDLLPRLDELEAAGARLDHMDGERSYDEIRGRVVAANAYIGARPVADALRRGARIVVTGRTTDAALILAPLVHEFGWAWDDWDRLAAGIAAGHILECGAQATGGNFTDWHRDAVDARHRLSDRRGSRPTAPSSSPSTPAPAASCTPRTITEQLLYEIGDPRAYLTPDVSADFTCVAADRRTAPTACASATRAARRRRRR